MKKNSKQPDQNQTDVSELTKKFEEAQALLEEKNNSYLRALADYHNLERRSAQMHEQATKQAQEKILREVLHLRDDVEKAAGFDTTGSWKLIVQKFDKVLTSFGVVEIEAMDKEFSPQTMECIEVVEGGQDNKVVKIHEKGYMFGDSLLKPARVSVSKARTDEIKVE